MFLSLFVCLFVVVYKSKTSKKRNIFGNPIGSQLPLELDEADDYSHLPPNPQKKMINDRIEAMQREVSQNEASLNAIKHMLDIYEKNPALGNVRQVRVIMVNTDTK